MKSALLEAGERGTRFLVAGRLSGQSFQAANSFEPPAELKHLFLTLDRFREDVSSTEIRKASL